MNDTEAPIESSRLEDDQAIPATDTTNANSRKLPFVIVCVLGLAFTGLLTPIPYSGRAITAIGDLAHAPIFGGLALATMILLQRFRPLPESNPSSGARSTRFRVVRRCLIVFAAFFFSGIAIELMQAVMGRTAAFHDVVANGLGILAAIVWWLSFFVRRVRPRAKSTVRILWATSGFLLAMAWWRPVTMLHDVYKVHAEFPLLASFETETEFQRWYFRDCKSSRSRLDATDGRFSMEVTYLPSDYPAVTLVEMEEDWSKLKSLELDVVLDENYAGRSLQFVIQVIDKAHQTSEADTYRGEWTIIPGKPKHISISRDEIVAGPDDREIDLSQVQYLDVMVLNPEDFATLRVDQLRVVESSLPQQ